MREGRSVDPVRGLYARPVRASRVRFLVAPVLAAALLVGCGDDEQAATPEGPEGIPRAVREYTAAQAGDDAERFCGSLTRRARASLSEDDESGEKCVEAVEESSRLVGQDDESARYLEGFYDGIRDAAADPDNLRIERTGTDTAKVRIRREGEPSFPVELRREDGRWRADEVAETATLR
jgi:hypothetical protein